MRLNLRPENLTTYDSPLVSFDGKVVIPRGQIRLLMLAGSEMVEVDFIVVDAYSPYTTLFRSILRRLMRCSRNLCIKFWRRLRMSHSSNGQIRW